MLAELITPLNVDDLKDAARSASDDTAIDTMLTALRAADELTALAVGIAGRLMPRGAIERATGLPTEFLLKLGAHRTGKEAAALTEAAATLKAMPAIQQAFARGDLSWDEVRLITAAVRVIPVTARASVDALIGAELAGHPDIDPEKLVALAFDEVARLRPDLLVEREDRTIEHGFLSIQPRLDGRGGRLRAEAGAEDFATIVEAVETRAPRPAGLDMDDAPTRARQRLDGLVAICESALAGGDTITRPRPRFLVHVDARDDAAALLWRAPGGPGRLSPVATGTLLCDAEVVPVIFNGARPIAVADVMGDPTPKARAALVARDAGCRFPGCTMPAAWADAHHINGRGPERTRSIDDLLLLCRRCHRRVHRHRWKITVHVDGTIGFRHRGRTFTSHPRVRGPARE